MNLILKVTIIITTMEVVHKGQYLKCQAHIILDMGDNSHCLGIPIKMLVHTNHELCLRLHIRDPNKLQFKNNIFVESWN